jgi:predicted nucleic acid-binding protein
MSTVIWGEVILVFRLAFGTATKGTVSFIITGDDDLLKPRSFRGIDIITPREFRTRLR